MKQLFIIFFAILIAFSVNAQKNISGRSPQKQVNISTADYSNGIPILSATVEFIEPSGNNLLDAEENAKIKITIINSGDNSAFDVAINVVVDNHDDISFNVSDKTYGEIKQNQTVVSYINIGATQNIQNSSRKFNISFTEHSGFVARPQNITIQTQKLLTPKLVFVETGIKELNGNGNNIIEQGELVLATVLIQNKGQGTAVNSRYTVKGFDSGLISTKTNDYPITKTLGNLEPGQSVSIKFAFSASWNYSGGDALPLKIQLSESRGSYGGTFDLGLELNVQQLAADDIETDGNYQDNVVIDDVSLTSDIDKNIPTNAKNNNRFALIIGNEHYVANNGLAVDVPFAINDAFVFKKYAENTLGIPSENIKYLVDVKTTAMKNEISSFINWMKIDGQNREFYIYYAGHGFYDAQTNPYLMPVDVKHTSVGDAIKLADFYADISEYNTKMTTVFLDACFSGGGRGNDGLVDGRTGVRRSTKNNNIEGNLVVFAASSGTQASKPYNTEKHGLFTYFLLKKLQETNGDISYDELANYLEIEVRTKSNGLFSEEQTPAIKVSPNIENTWKNIRFK